MPTYTKKVARHDKITIDGVDVSESFSVMGRPSVDEKVPMGGFSVSPTDETLPGARTQTFTGTAFYTEELAAICEPLYAASTAFVMTWQPDGLVDATREIYSGTVVLDEFSPSNERGSRSEFPFVASPSTTTGITVGNWT